MAKQVFLSSCITAKKTSNIDIGVLDHSLLAQANRKTQLNTEAPARGTQQYSSEAHHTTQPSTEAPERGQKPTQLTSEAAAPSGNSPTQLARKKVQLEIPLTASEIQADLDHEDILVPVAPEPSKTE
jgi:hypothetical protein